MNVYTSIDGELQVAANKALRRALLDYTRRHGYRGVIDSIDMSKLAAKSGDSEVAQSLEKLDGDPFELDLVSDQRIGGLRKGVVVSINHNLNTEDQESLSSNETPVVKKENEEIEDISSATVLISNFENINLPFKGGIDWARAYIEVDKQGAEPSVIEDVLSVGDVIWLEQRDGQWLLAEIPEVEGAMVSLDSSDGAIRSMVGGFD